MYNKEEINFYYIAKIFSNKTMWLFYLYVGGISMKEKILQLINLGYSYRYLAKICDVHHTTLSNWCNDLTELTPTIKSRIKRGLLEHLQKISKIIGDENENWN